MTDSLFPELGFYTLPGHIFDPRPAFREFADADQLGIGTVWISERLNTKDVGVLTGAAMGICPRMTVGAGLISHLALRNPMVVASYAATASLMSEGKFILGIGRGTKSLVEAAGIPHATDDYLVDYIDILRRLWAGEAVDYEGPVGHLNGATLGIALDNPPPIYFGAVGFKNAELAGRISDGVLFNTFWTAEATAEGVRRAQLGAERAGRDPAGIKACAILAAACEVSEEVELITIIRRLNTYLFFPQEWRATLKINGWSQATSERLIETLRSFDGDRATGTIGDEHTTRDLDHLRRIRDAWPREWIETSTAIGTADQAVKAVAERFAAGVDSVAFHASSPSNLAPLITAWASIRHKFIK